MKKKITLNKKNNSLLNAVIEIDEVEYLINKNAAKAISDKKKNIFLKRLIDGEKRLFSLDIIHTSIHKHGIIDYL